MSASKANPPMSESAKISRRNIAKRAMRKAQRNAIQEDLRYGLKPVIVAKKKRIR